MIDKYCKDCKHFEYLGEQPVCLRNQHRLIDGVRVSGCALDADLERISESGCGQSGKYFEPKVEPDAAAHLFYETADQWRGAYQRLCERHKDLLGVRNSLETDLKIQKNQNEAILKIIDKQNTQIVEVMNERDRWKQGEQALSSRYEALKDENKRLKSKCQEMDKQLDPPLYTGYRLGKDEIRWLRTQLEAKEEEIRMYRETVARARQDERRKCWKTVKGLINTLAPLGPVWVAWDSPIRYVANAIRPEGEEKI